MGLSGYLKIDDIDGESLRSGHENEIEVRGVHWQMQRATASTRGSTRSRSRARVDNLTCVKTTDASSPYLALACLQGRSYGEAVLTLSREADGAQLDHVIITMTNVVVAGFEMANDGSNPDDDMLTEHVALLFESFTYRYVVAAGDEHEVEFDIAAGV